MTFEEGQELAGYERMLSFCETSAKDNLRVDIAFALLAKELKAQQANTASLEDPAAGRFRLGDFNTSTIRTGWKGCCAGYGW